MNAKEQMDALVAEIRDWSFNSATLGPWATQNGLRDIAERLSAMPVSDAEPVAWRWHYGGGHVGPWHEMTKFHKPAKEIEYAYAAPPALPQAEPVAWRYWKGKFNCYDFAEQREAIREEDRSTAEPLYAATPACVCGDPSKLNTVHRQDGPCHQPEPALPDGWIAVPVEPTREMVQAGARLVKANLPFHTGTLDIYKAMLAARPEHMK